MYSFKFNVIMKQKFCVNFNVEVICSEEGKRNYIVRAVLDPRQMPVTIGVFDASFDVVDVIDDFTNNLINSGKHEQDS